MAHPRGQWNEIFEESDENVAKSEKSQVVVRFQDSGYGHIRPTLAEVDEDKRSQENIKHHQRALVSRGVPHSLGAIGILHNTNKLPAPGISIPFEVLA